MYNDLQQRLTHAMLALYERTKAETGYDGRRCRQMVLEHGGSETARRLLRATLVPEGYVALLELDRLDLTVEALILQEPWNKLFSEEELRAARERLEKDGFDGG